MDPVDELTQNSARRPRERFTKVKSVVKPFGYSPRVLDLTAKYRPLFLALFVAAGLGAAQGYKRREATGRAFPKWVAALLASEYIFRHEAVTGPESYRVTAKRWESAVIDFFASFHTK